MDLNEFDIIRKFFAEPGLCFQRDGILLGNGDDAAVLRQSHDESVIVTTDVLVAGRHFPVDADPAAIAYRALAVNLSDLAAMAAEPWCFTLGLTLPEVNESWLGGFSSGLSQLAQQYNCPLVGGDLNQGPLSIAIQAQGLIDGEPLLRSGALVGDTVYVSGSIGDAAVALLSLGLPTHLGADFRLGGDSVASSHATYLTDRYFHPQPRLQLAAGLRPFINACIDISDGLAGDLGHILEASAVGATLSLDSLPFSEAVLATVSPENARRAALCGGDDYELCFTASLEQQQRIMQTAESVGVPVTAVGTIIAGSGLQLTAENGPVPDLQQQAFRHF